MGKAARQRVATLFDIQGHARAIERVFDEILIARAPALSEPGATLGQLMDLLGKAVQGGVVDIGMSTGAWRRAMADAGRRQRALVSPGR
jgi:hypothetical protein